MYLMIGRIGISSQRNNMLTKHLKEQNMSYVQHLLHATKTSAKLAACSGALLVHAIFPFVLVDFASKRVEIK